MVDKRLRVLYVSLTTGSAGRSASALGLCAALGCWHGPSACLVPCFWLLLAAPSLGLPTGPRGEERSNSRGGRRGELSGAWGITQGLPVTAQALSIALSPSNFCSKLPSAVTTSHTWLLSSGNVAGVIRTGSEVLFNFIGLNARSHLW